MRKTARAALLPAAALFCSIGGCDGPSADGRPPVRIGYFHGGRTALMMRAYEKGEFRERGVEVEFYTKDLRSRSYRKLPRSIRELNEGGVGRVGKARGTELIDAMLEGKFDLAMVGESSFVSSLYAGKRVIAIAELGHDAPEHSGHAFMMRKGLKAARAEDYFGKVLVSRRAGPGDAIFLKEYLEKSGVRLKTDIVELPSLPRSPEEKARLPKDKVIVVDQVFEDAMWKGVDAGVVDGGYFHLMSVPHMSDAFNIIEPVQEWSNPELSHALLVCRPDFLKAHRGRLVSILEAYISRIRYEHGLSYDERVRPRPKGLRLAMNFHGMNLPQYDAVPTADPALLREVIRLMDKHGFIKKTDLDIADFVDNSLVEDALKNLGVEKNDARRRPEY